MLIDSRRITPDDRRRWELDNRVDKLNARPDNDRLNSLEAMAEETVTSFVEAREGAVYCGVSWGKDSVVVAHLVRLFVPAVPLVWVRVRYVENPDCHAVRDAFLREYPGPYDEIVVEPGVNRSGGTSLLGFAEARRRHGDAYLSGVRAQESGDRKLRMMRSGTDTKNTCAPIGWWTALDVFAYIERHLLPVHPAYAMTMGGVLDRTKLRVSSLGGGRGTGMGRREWEMRYYAREMAELMRLGHA